MSAEERTAFYCQVRASNPQYTSSEIRAALGLSRQIAYEADKAIHLVYDRRLNWSETCALAESYLRTREDRP